MLRNWLVTALRALRHEPQFAAINILGLAVALAAALLVLTFVRHELSYDRWIPGHERIFRVESEINLGAARSFHANGAPFAAKKLFEESLPGVVAVSRYTPGMNTLEVDDHLFRQYLAFVDPAFLEVFDLPFIEGDARSALADPGSVLLTRATARRLFGEGSPLGKTLSLGTGERELRVTGVLEDMPSNSHFHPSQGIGLEALLLHDDIPSFEPAQWFSIGGAVYVKFAEGVDVDAAGARLDAITAPHLPEQIARPEGAPPQISFSLRPLADIHLAGRFASDSDATPGIVTVIGFALVGAVILALAAFNFTNLSLARSLARAREVALRKVVGASRRQIAAQFLGESLLVMLLALAVGVALAEVLLPVFSDLVGSEIAMSFAGDPVTLPAALLLGIVVGLAGGAYPALIASGYRPARLVHGGEERQQGNRVRAGLTVLQFAAAIGLVACTAVVVAQVRHVRSADLGYVPDEVVVVHNPGGADLAERFMTFADALAREPGILATATAMTEPSGGSRTTSSMPLVTNPDERINVDMQSLSRGYFDTLQIAPLHGRLLEQTREGDSIRGEGEDRQGALVMNESAALALGFDSAEAAIGDVRAWPIDAAGAATIEIVGIVPDLNLRSLKEPVEPTFFFSYAADAPQNREARVALVRLDPGARDAGLAATDRLWAEMFPDQPVEREFLDAQLAAQYDADARRAGMFGAAAGIAILIAAMGLYGMAGHAALRRTREIALRRAMGANVRDIARLLLWQFTRPVLLANLIAWPAAFLVVRDWLEGFASRIDLALWPFLLAGGAALAIALATVAGHTIRVARTHPALALREE